MHARFLTLGAAVLVSGCGWSIESAREAAVQRACDFHQRCMQIGSGKTYATYDECLTRQRTFWLDMWPTAACSGRENGAAIDACLTAIQNTSCTSLIDVLATLDKYDKKNVCAR
jgi:hypothetical protein